MKEKELRRSMAVFPIGTVMKLTDLTARQIRYYEDQGLITPERTSGNRRMFSLNDMDRLLEIKDFLAKTYKIVSPAGMDSVIIKSAEVPPIIPALLLIETLIIMPSMVNTGTKNRVTQNSL